MTTPAWTDGAVATGALSAAPATAVSQSAGGNVSGVLRPADGVRSADAADRAPSCGRGRWEAPSTFDERGIRIPSPSLRRESPYGPARLQLRGDLTPRKGAEPDVVKHLVEENESQKRLLDLRQQQVKHVADRALQAAQEAQAAERDKEAATVEALKARQEAENAKGAAFAHHQHAEVKTQLAAEVATESMKRGHAAETIINNQVAALSHAQREREDLVQQARVRIGELEAAKVGLEQANARHTHANIEGREQLRAECAEAQKFQQIVAHRESALQQALARAVEAEGKLVGCQLQLSAMADPSAIAAAQI